MRTILFLGLAIGAAFMANWFTIERDGDRTRIDINKDEIRNDAQHAIEKGREILDKREHGRQANTPPGDGYAPTQQGWPQSAPVQNTGYSDQGPYGNAPGYGYQPGPGEQNYGTQNQGPPPAGQPYGNQSAPSGYPLTYPASARTPPPWRQ
ncbi:hypothetical protein [Allorhodopirellula heiligendammensis]|uniref:Uncharacterized protein n=1 Tax=Allorhodopirellula heiligendammensis TaxID=2714739 RepID=A0A5C6C1K4_9BACT|nr:hypothetical protein [Allorhodopirellula heiligendammensis]TWU16739.1 hypothetical protein Poly21_39450 [Allorhodopirellula heiligendammensis]